MCSCAIASPIGLYLSLSHKQVTKLLFIYDWARNNSGSGSASFPNWDAVTANCTDLCERQIMIRKELKDGGWKRDIATWCCQKPLSTCSTENNAMFCFRTFYNTPFGHCRRSQFTLAISNCFETAGEIRVTSGGYKINLLRSTSMTLGALLLQ